jgi:OOP family OmpA-OmpF porin
VSSRKMRRVLMKLRSALLTATLLATPVAAMAQPVDGLYVGAGLGYGYTTETKVKNLKFPGIGTFTQRDLGGAKLSGDGGFAGVGSVGYGLGNGFRVEVQGDYLTQVDHFKNLPAGTTGKAQLQKYGAFVNGLFDFDIGQDFVFPYVGAGVGYQWTEPTKFAVQDPGVASLAFRDHAEGSVAGQGLVGASFPIGVPGLSLTAEYRFIYEFEKDSFKGGANIAGIGSTGVSTKLDNQMSHVGLIGFRYAFNVPTPPPPAAQVVAPPVAPAARTYLVFFDWDKADLTARARQIISDAATNATAVKVTTIEVSGYADRSGTPAYNQKLSLRRADNVAAELVRLGIPKAEISIMAFGDTHPLVPTAAGVREPQNRRVEIVLK